MALMELPAKVAFTTFVPDYGIVNPNPDSPIESERIARFPEGSLKLFVENGWVDMPEDYDSDAEIVAEVPADPAPEVEQAPAVDEAPAAEQPEAAPKKK